jgi:hypothetical protein
VRIAQCDIGDMATTWPQVTAWPNDLREHATHLSKYLRDALLCIETAKDQPVPTPLVKTIITATYTFLSKVEATPDYRAVMEALGTISTAVQQATVTSQQAIMISQDTNTITKEVAEANKITAELLQETNNIAKAIQTFPTTKSSYASVLSGGGAPASKPVTIATKTSSFIQAQREIIVKIADPSTIENLRSKNPRTLQAHVDRAIEQSKNRNIETIKVASANQLKSGDLSIKTTSTEKAEALKQFADDWTSRIGSGTSVQIPTYGIIAHGIRTRSMEMEKFEEIRTELLQDNKPFIPRAEIKYVGWLSRSALTKSASSIIVEFTSPEDANKIIDEGLIWQGEVFQCERYDRQCRLKQCYNCQKYGHIGTQCKAPTACGYCAGQHSSRDCPSKADKTSARKCATCQGEHEAWNNRCPVRKTELSRVKSAYDSRQPYHFVPTRRHASSDGNAPPRSTPTEEFTTVVGPGYRRPRVNPSLMSSTQEQRSRSPTKRMTKRVYTGNDNGTVGDENRDVVMIECSQRPQRTIIPTRRALGAITPNEYIRPQEQEEEL